MKISGDSVIQYIKSQKTQKSGLVPTSNQENLRIYSWYSLPDLSHYHRTFALSHCYLHCSTVLLSQHFFTVPISQDFPTVPLTQDFPAISLSSSLLHCPTVPGHFYCPTALLFHCPPTVPCPTVLLSQHISTVPLPYCSTALLCFYCPTVPLLYTQNTSRDQLQRTCNGREWTAPGLSTD